MVGRSLAALRVIPGGPSPAPVDLGANFAAIRDAVRAVVEAKRATGRALDESWRVLSDTLYEGLVEGHYDFATRSVSQAVRDYIARETGKPYVEAPQDQLKLSSVSRYFFASVMRNGAAPSRQDVNRLSTLGAAGALYGRKPTECMDDPDIGGGSISGLLTAFRKALDPDGRLAAERSAARQKQQEDKVLTSVELAAKLIKEHSEKLPEIVDTLTTSGDIGRTFDPDHDKIVVGFVGSTAAGRKLMADRLGITDDQPHLVKLVKRNGSFNVIWCDVGEEVPSPAQQREAETDEEEGADE
jgi:hypothetical protein